MSFIVYTSGRSRTAWLASFLTYNDYHCHFEKVMEAPSMEKAVSFLGPFSGSAETCAAPIWKAIRAARPAARRVVVRRPEAEILDSFVRAGGERRKFETKSLSIGLKIQGNFLDEITATPGTLTVKFSDLHREDVCAAIFEHCLPEPFDREHWDRLKDRNIQVDVPSYLSAHHPNMRLYEYAA